MLLPTLYCEPAGKGPVATRRVREAWVAEVKNVSVEQQSPTRLYSTPVHPEARLEILGVTCRTERAVDVRHGDDVVAALGLGDYAEAAEVSQGHRRQTRSRGV